MLKTTPQNTIFYNLCCMLKNVDNTKTQKTITIYVYVILIIQYLNFVKMCVLSATHTPN